MKNVQNELIRLTGKDPISRRGGNPDKDVIMFLKKLKKFESDSRKSKIMVGEKDIGGGCAC